jgi:hypothetical protein
MMDELVAQISQRTGIPAEQAQQAAHTAVEFLDTRLPAPVGGNLKKLVDGGGGMPDVGGLAGNLGGMFGGGK